MIRATREQLRQKKQLAIDRINSVHLRNIANSDGNVFLISTAYPGVWMEHAFDALVYARLGLAENGAQVAKNQLMLFIKNRKSDGRMPYKVLDMTIAGPSWKNASPIGYSQLQECVSFGQLCLEVYELTGDRAFLNEAYSAMAGWDAWLCANRMTLGRGLIETFCVYDTGHDNSARFGDIPNSCADDQGQKYADVPALPMLSPDVNAVFYGNRRALADMAGLLNKPEEQKSWQRRAEDLRVAMCEQLYDKNDAFFYDVDHAGTVRKFKSIAITNVFTERALTDEQFEEIYARHMLCPEEFYTPYRFPSMALDDATRLGHAPKNCWGYYTQALTMLRCQRWMDHYGKGTEYDAMLENWAHAYAAQQGEAQFCQELDPVTGEMVDCSRWYSSAMLTYLYALRRLKID